MTLFNPIVPNNMSVSSTSSTFVFDPQYSSARIVNTGTVNCYVIFGSSLQGSVTATTNGMVLLPNAIELFYPDSRDTIAAITATGTTTLNITLGHGE